MYAMTPMEYGERVQAELRSLLEERFEDRDSPVRSRAALSKALGHDARQYVASRFAPQGKAGVIRDLTVPDLLAFARAMGLDAHELLARAQAAVDGGESGSGAEIHRLPIPSDPSSRLGAVASTEAAVEPGDLEE